MTAKQLDDYRRSLTALANRLDRTLAHDQREMMNMDEPDFPGGPVPSTGEVLDSGTLEVEAGLAANEETLLAEVKAALARIDAGRFGHCEQCGATIGRDRLNAIPYARDCIRCAEKPRE
jgi:RNA polymerase-binding transcription factor DksA